MRWVEEDGEATTRHNIEKKFVKIIKMKSSSHDVVSVLNYHHMISEDN